VREHQRQQPLNEAAAFEPTGLRRQHGFRRTRATWSLHYSLYHTNKTISIWFALISRWSHFRPQILGCRLSCAYLSDEKW
jgi:hypothetical protein